MSAGLNVWPWPELPPGLLSSKVIEYLRAFLFGRLGWNRLGGTLIISGAFGLFRKAVGPDRALIGELYLPLERLVRYYGAGLDLPSNFHLISTPANR